VLQPPFGALSRSVSDAPTTRTQSILCFSHRLGGTRSGRCCWPWPAIAEVIGCPYRVVVVTATPFDFQWAGL